MAGGDSVIICSFIVFRPFSPLKYLKTVVPATKNLERVVTTSAADGKKRQLNLKFLQSTTSKKQKRHHIQYPDT